MDEMEQAVAEVLVTHNVQHCAVLARAIMTRLREGPCIKPAVPIIATTPAVAVTDIHDPNYDPGVDKTATV